MLAWIENRYCIEVCRYFKEGSSLDMMISFSEEDHPDFCSFLSKKILDKEPVLYQDANGQCILLVEGCSFTFPSPDEESESFKNLSNEEIVLSRKIYGDVVDRISLKDRKRFICHQAYGSLQGRILPPPCGLS